MVKKNQIKLQVERTLDDLDLFRESFHESLLASGLNPDFASHFELCSYEVIANIIEHDNPLHNEDPDIYIEFESQSARGILTISYYGPEFDLTQRPLPDIATHFKKGLNRGLGIYIIHTLMQKVSYNYTQGFNRLTMERNL